MPHDLFVAPLTCPVCRTTTDDGSTDVQTRARRSPRGVELRPGDVVDTPPAELVHGGYLPLASPPSAGEPVYLLESWECPACGNGNWAEVVLEGGAMRSMRAVPLTGATLSRAHFATQALVYALPGPGEVDDAVRHRLSEALRLGGRAGRRRRDRRGPAGERMARIIDGTAISRAIRAEVKAEVAELAAAGVVPGLAVVLVGADPASAVYVRMKGRACQRAGIASRTIELPEETTQEELYATIDALNADPAIHGILVQLPLPAHVETKPVLERIDPDKDVDGFNTLNAGRAFIGDPRAFVPATTAGILELLRRENIPTAGKHVVIVGRSLIVSKPLMSLLIAPGADATVTLVHRLTADIAPHTRMADILVVAVGKPGLIRADMVKHGAVVIDVGITRVPDPDAEGSQRLVGDVDYEAVSEIASAITPVPGGVGPMTIAMLLVNTVRAARTT